MSQQEILDAIPHRPPMLLLDEIVSREGQRIVCRKRFRDDEFFVQGHYPDFPLVPGVILCECALQAGAVLLAGLVQGAQGVPVVTRLKEVKFRSMVRPGDSVDLEVELVERLREAYFLRARVLKDGRPAVRFEFGCVLTESERG